MTGHNVVTKDIFAGAEKVEILGKLPGLLWGFIDTARGLAASLSGGPADHSEAIHDITRLLAVLNSAADHLGHQALREQLSRQTKMLDDFSQGAMPLAEFCKAFVVDLPKLEELGGHRPEGDGFLDKAFLSHQVEVLEKIKAGRSADIVISVEVLDDVRDYLASEVMTEGISSILIIDNAGTLIVNIGDNLELDVIGLAAVAAANFAATEQIARLIGERDFVLLFYKGHNESFHFSRVGQEYIIVTIFSNSLSLGLLRLKIAEVAKVLEQKLPKRQA
jgi:predicted regulator of Ras-like GTPase activity (Roadblock/LC7/MglB family)